MSLVKIDNPNAEVFPVKDIDTGERLLAIGPQQDGSYVISANPITINSGKTWVRVNLV